MTSLITRLPAHSLRLGAAAVLAATALLGTTTSTVADPATACAAPKKPGFDRGGYEACTEISHDQHERGEITDEEVHDAMMYCCDQYGGRWDWYRDDCVEDWTSSAQLPQFPGPTEQAPPPAGPIAPLPSVPPVQTR